MKASFFTLSENQWKVPGYPVNQVPLENSVESHWNIREIPLETSENLLETREIPQETSETSLNDQSHGTEIPSCTWVTGAC